MEERKKELGIDFSLLARARGIIFFLCILCTFPPKNSLNDNLDGRLTDAERKFAKEEYVKVAPTIVNKYARTNPGSKFWKFDETQTQTQLD